MTPPSVNIALQSAIDLLENDTRLNTFHMALLLSVLRVGARQGSVEAVIATRATLMSLSHIRTLPTYHKYFRELQQFGYICYSPSYHPAGKSRIVVKLSQLNYRE